MPTSIGNDFMQKTRYEHLDRSQQEKGVEQPPLELPWPSDAKLIPLPPHEKMDIPGINLLTAIEKRKSVRKYNEQSLSMDELSFLLWCTQGVKSITSRPATLRTVPSAGSRHPFETYLLVNRVEGLKTGLYRFIASQHALLAVEISSEVTEKVTHACIDQVQVRNSAVTFIWDAVVERSFWRYDQRAYRYMHLDAGHVCQNLYLAAEAISCGVCGIAAFNDDLLNAAVGADGNREFVIYAASLGKVGKEE
jgi:SagB-type dehydrogenase family enzyme